MDAKGNHAGWVKRGCQALNCHLLPIFSFLFRRFNQSHFTFKWAIAGSGRRQAAWRKLSPTRVAMPHFQHRGRTPCFTTTLLKILQRINFIALSLTIKWLTNHQTPAIFNGKKDKGTHSARVFLRKRSKKDRKTCPLDIPISFLFTTQHLGDSLTLWISYYITQGRKSCFIQLSPTVTQHQTHLPQIPKCYPIFVVMRIKNKSDDNNRKTTSSVN